MTRSGKKQQRRRVVVGLTTAATVGLATAVGVALAQPRFSGPTDYPAGARPFSVAVGELNGDGVPDLAVASSGSSSVAVLLGRPDATFGSPTSFAAGKRAGGGGDCPPQRRRAR